VPAPAADMQVTSRSRRRQAAPAAVGACEATAAHEETRCLPVLQYHLDRGDPPSSQPRLRVMSSTDDDVSDPNDPLVASIKNLLRAPIPSTFGDTEDSSGVLGSAGDGPPSFAMPPTGSSLRALSDEMHQGDREGDGFGMLAFDIVRRRTANDRDHGHLGTPPLCP
jgi:hypothetical protein